MRWAKAVLFFFFLLAVGSETRADIDTVRIRDFLFAPSSLTITAGDTVVFKVTQQCCLQHTTTRFFSPKPWNSGPMALNQTFQVVFQFADSGTFSYVCATHEGLGMIGSITALPVATVPNAGALSWVGLLLLGMSLTAAGIWILDRRRRPA